MTLHPGSNMEAGVGRVPALSYRMSQMASWDRPGLVLQLLRLLHLRGQPSSLGVFDVLEATQ